ncbi:multidrug effflux MFS transporter [Vibrio hippocampi]|uniref:Bcr/CflA family efflux transporter n=1 Tax=Vibrio hippocampi TaxID=654686 RepID=A0ABN8DL87_9VIBR|nr:multidrug effflux MFS transporter [Vibrio hippocampi]CAH0529533.1 Bicyclomycin resistance protein [Vibrio hippocampi]
MKASIPINLLLVLVAVSAISPFATDAYLSAIPIMAETLATETSLVAITVSLYIFGLAFGQLFGGPWSDRYGRKPIIILGLAIFSVGSMLISSAGDIHSLWAFRLLQAMGAGIAVVGIPAIIRDVSTGKESAKLFSLIMLISMLAPSIAPSVGTLILKTLGWRWIFLALAIMAVLIGLLTFMAMPKVMTKQPRVRSGGYLSVIKEYRALGYLVAQGFGFAVLMTFLTNASFAYIEHFKVSEELFSILLVFNVLGVASVNRINNYLLRKHEPATLLKRFLTVQVCSALVLLLVVCLAPDNLILTVIAFVMTTSAMGGLMPNSGACFMQYFGKNAGTAAALLGTFQYIIAAGVSALAALMSTVSIVPIALVMVMSSSIALAGAWYSARYQQAMN